LLSRGNMRPPLAPVLWPEACLSEIAVPVHFSGEDAMQQALAGAYGSVVSVRTRRWNRFLFSVLLHATGLLLLLRIGVWTPQWQPVRIARTVTLVAPSLVSQADPPPALQAPTVRAVAELDSVEPVRIPVQPQPQPPLTDKIIPQIKQQPAPLPAPVVDLPRFTPRVQTGTFGGGSSAKPTLQAPERAVQTGGFGDPDGVAGQGHAGAKLIVPSVGSFDLPRGPGYGNGTGGSRGLRGTVESSGFGNGVAGPGSGSGSGPEQGSVVAAGFGDRSATPAPVPKAHTAPAVAALTPVEILNKPKPAYTDEARQLRLEGEVLLEVVFQANGQLRVLRVVRGLGHGLDESALRAAQQIRFHPARRGGQPVDSTATVHMVFELAN
jgi:TonB family protein